MQAKRAKAIETHLYLVLKNGRRTIDASQRAAEAGGFAAKSGGHAASVKHGNTVHALIELSRGVPIHGHYGHYGILRVTMEILWEHYAGLHSTAHGNYYI